MGDTPAEMPHTGAQCECIRVWSRESLWPVSSWMAFVQDVAAGVWSFQVCMVHAYAVEGGIFRVTRQLTLHDAKIKQCDRDLLSHLISMPSTPAHRACPFIVQYPTFIFTPSYLHSTPTTNLNPNVRSLFHSSLQKQAVEDRLTVLLAGLIDGGCSGP